MRNELIDVEIKKALECCKIAVFHKDCLNLNCPFVTEYGCNIEQADLRNEALNLINHRDAEIESLMLENEDLKSSFCGIELNAEKLHRQWADIRERTIEDLMFNLDNEISTYRSEGKDLNIYAWLKNYAKEMVVKTNEF